MRTLILSAALVLSVVISAQGTWTQKANFIGSARKYAGIFEIGTKIYIGTGEQNGGTRVNDLFEYDPVGDSWVAKTSYSGNGRRWTQSYSVGGQIGYIIMGESSGYYLDGKSYDQGSDTWTSIVAFPGAGRFGAACFSIGVKLYVVAGGDASAMNDTWEYNTGTGAWAQKASLTNGRWGCTGFTLAGQGYVTCGSNGTVLFDDLWCYNPTANSWTQKSNFAGGARQYAAAFTVGNYAYCGTGYDGLLHTDFYEYDPVSDSWNTVTSFPGNARWGASGVEWNGNGYFGIGGTTSSSGNFQDWWEFTPSPAGTDDLREIQMKLYPNPASDILNVSIGESMGQTGLKIVNMAGEVVLEQVLQGGDNTIDVSSVSSGRYQAVVQVGNRRSSRSLIIQ